MTCKRCGGLLLLVRVFGAENELMCIICGRSPAGTRAPTPEDALWVRGAHTGPRAPHAMSGHYGDSLSNERRCTAETPRGRCRNPGKARGRCWLHSGRRR